MINVIRSQLKTAMYDKDETKKGILRVILGDISTLESRSGKTSTNEDVQRIIKKLIEGNTELLKYKVSDQIVEENVILNSFLPKTLSQNEIKGELNKIVVDVKNAKSDGQATGIAMKFLKQQSLSIEGSDVSFVIKEMRN